MNEDFADIMTGPKIKTIDPTAEELADDDHVDCPASPSDSIGAITAGCGS